MKKVTNISDRQQGTYTLMVKCMNCFYSDQVRLPKGVAWRLYNKSIDGPPEKTHKFACRNCGCRMLDRDFEKQEESHLKAAVKEQVEQDFFSEPSLYDGLEHTDGGN